MPITVYPSAGYNSYISVDDATDYLELSLHANSWNNASSSDKEKALVTAARLLDRYRWIGTKTDAAQGLDWPRTGVSDAEGNEIEDDEIPQQILDLQCELAVILLDDRTAQNGSNGPVKFLATGKVTVEFFGSPTTKGPVFRAVQRMAGEFLASRGWSAAGTVYGNEDEDGEAIESDFSDKERWNRGEPLS